MANPVWGWMGLSGPLPNLWMCRKRLCGEGKVLIFLGSHLASLVFLLSHSELLPASSSNWRASCRKAAPWIHLHASKASTDPGSHWKWKFLSHVQLFVTPWAVQAMEFSRPEYWSISPEKVAIPFSRASFQPSNQTQVYLLQGIFPTQGSNPGLPHCRQILYQLNLQGSPPGSIWFLIDSG